MARTSTTKRKKSPRAGTGFKPSMAQREVVSVMATTGVKSEHIAKCILNPKSGKPISRTVLWRHFSEELKGGGKAGTALAINTLIQAMMDGGRNGLTAVIFWLKTRENELFSERRITENYEKNGTDELGKLTPEQAIRVAENVIKGAKLTKAFRELQKEKDDEPTIQ